jgi:hypothetical protein
MTSDKNLKENIADIPSDVADELLNLKPVQFNMIGAKRLQYGLIAQDVEFTKLDNIVFQNDRGVRSVAYTQIIPLLILHIQALVKRVEELESR